jgi:hypothetical protein
VTAGTHDLTLGEREVVKTFPSWDRDEPGREWSGLRLLHRHAEGLAPQPLARREVDGRPAVVMSRLHGCSLGASPLSSGQVAVVAAAMTRLHTAVPSAELSELPTRLWGAAEAMDGLRKVYAAGVGTVGSCQVGGAVREAERWLASDEAGRLAVPADPVFAQADGNLANFLWDGQGCCLVDFEDSGVSDRAYEVADLVEHVSVWLAGVMDAEELVSRLDLEPGQLIRVHRMRRLFATFWLYMLLPGNPAHHRNPPGSVERQAERVLGLLG